MRIELWEDHSIIGEIYRVIHEQNARGRAIHYVDLNEEELIALRHELGLDHDAVPANILGVRVKIEGHTSDVWAGVEQRRRDWSQAGDAANSLLRDAGFRTDNLPFGPTDSQFRDFMGDQLDNEDDDDDI